MRDCCHFRWETIVNAPEPFPIRPVFYVNRSGKSDNCGWRENGWKGVPDIWLKCSKTWELDNTPGRAKIVQDYVLCRAKQKMCHLYCPLFAWCYIQYIQFLMMTRWYNKSNGGFIKGILRGVRCTKSLRVLFLHRRPPSWTTLVYCTHEQYSSLMNPP